MDLLPEEVYYQLLILHADHIIWFLLLSCLLPMPGRRHGKEGFQPWSLDSCAPKTIGGTLRTKSRVFARIAPSKTSSGVVLRSGPHTFGIIALTRQREPYPA